MNPGPAVLLLVLSVAFQATAAPLYRAGSLEPDFPFLALVYLAFFAEPAALFWAAVLTAAAIDGVSIDPFGARLLAYIPVLLFLNRFRRGFVAESALLRCGLTLLGCAAAFTIEGAFVAWREGRWIGLGFEMRLALYTALLGLAVHGVIDRWRFRLGWARDRFFA